MENSYFFDISPMISEEIAVWPGDCPFKRNVSMSFIRGDHLTLSSMQSTFHLGAHADAPSHYHPTGKSIESVDLTCYFGQCQVIDIKIKKGERIGVEHLLNKDFLAPRVLFCTGSFPSSYLFNQDFCSLSPELIDFAAEKKVRLLGIDTPSVDPFDSKKLEAHQSLYKHQMAVLEGLKLDHVPPGVYYLMALPLPFKGADASPVRAILIPLSLLNFEMKS